MKKFLKITGLVAGIILALLLACLLLLQSPKVQTLVARKVIGVFSEKIDGDITVGKILFRPFNAFILKDICIVDRAPYIEEGRTPVDTLAKISYATAKIRPAALLRKKQVDVSEIYVRGGFFALSVEPDRKNNVSRIFRLKPKAEKKEPEDKDIVRVDKVEIEDFRYIMVNYNPPKSGKIRIIPDDAIDWRDLDVQDIHIKGHGIRVHGQTIDGIADELSFREKSGFTVYKASGEAKVVSGQVTSVKNLKIRDAYSDIHMNEFRMTFAGMPAMRHFVSEVCLEGDILESRLSLETIGFFAPALKTRSMVANLSGKVHGCINGLFVKDLTFNTLDSGVSARLNGRLTGIPKVGEMDLDYRIGSFNFTLPELEKFIAGWVPGVRLDLGKFAKRERFTFDGTVKGQLNKLAVNGSLVSGAGGLKADISLQNMLNAAKPLDIGGEVRTQNLNIGRIAGIKSIGPLTMMTRIRASLGAGDPKVAIDSLSISRLRLFDYDYSSIAAVGAYSGSAFDGRIISQDPNFNFLFQGMFTLSRKTRNAVYKFYANIGHADLNALHLDKRGTSQLSLMTNVNFNRVDGGDLLGNINVRNIQLTDRNGIHDIGDISVVSHINDDVNRIKLDSKFLEATYVGSAFLTEFIKDLQEVSTMRELPSVFRDKEYPWGGNWYDLHFQTHDTREISAFLKEGIYIADSTDLRVSIDTSGVLSGALRSRRIALRDKYLKDISFNFDNKDGHLGGVLASGEMNFKPVLTRNNRLELFAEKDRISAGFSYDNETETANKGMIRLAGNFSRSPKDSLILRAEVLPSGVYINGNPWSIGGDGIGLYGSDIRIGHLDLVNEGQSIRFAGGYSSEHADTLRMNLLQFDIAALNPFLGNAMEVRGIATGHAMLASPLKDGMGLLLNLSVEDTFIGQSPLGTLQLRSIWDDARESFRFLIRNELEGARNLDAHAYLSPSRKTLDGRLQLDRLDLAYAAPVLRTVFSEMGGRLSGGVEFSGPWSALELQGEDLQLDEALFRVGFTKVPYTATGPLKLNSDGVTFENVALRDRHDGRGRLNGRIGWNHFKDMNMDLGIDMTQMEALDLAEGDNDSFYGHIFATGHVDIAGPLSSLLLEVDASTAKEGDFHVPLAGSNEAGTSNLLTFKKPEVPVYVDPYDQMMTRLNEDVKRKSDLDIKLHIRPSTSVQAFIEIDKASGNVLSGRGNGLLDVEFKPSTSLFTINGNYTLTEGLFHFSVLNLASRDFNIQDGSSIKFNGDIMDSDLDIDALYRTKASIGTLIADTTSVSTRRTVDCGIGITDKIRNPRISFSITVPDLDPSTQVRVENALNSEDKVQKQLLSLLISGGFLPDEPSGIVNNSTVLRSTVTEIMASQLSSILQKLDIPIDFGLDYQQTGSGDDIFDVAVSTELFNNRVIVNGAIGNRQYSSGASGQEVVGDLDIEIKLDKPGALRLNLFSHSADQYTNYLDRLQRSGVGLTYQKEYNNFRDFLRSIFTRRRRDPSNRDAWLMRQEKNHIRITPDPSPKEGSTDDKNEESEIQ